MSLPELDLSDPAFVQDPYPRLAELRRREPVLWNRQQRCWLALSHETARVVLHDERFGVEHPDASDGGWGEDPPTALHRFSDSLLYRDPPTHTRLRAALGRGFTPRAVQRHGRRIAEIAHSLLDQLSVSDRVDLVRGYARPLPLVVICELLGVPLADRDQFAAWSAQLAPIVGFPEHDKLPEILTAADNYCQYLTEALRQRIGHPADDLLGVLADEAVEGDLEFYEAVAAAMLMLFAGHDTTTNLIANTIWHTLEDHSDWEALVSDPQVIPSAIEETLRYASPLQVATGGGRYARHDLILGSTPLQRGSRVIPVIAAANRDPERFEDPDRYLIGRSPNPHLGFGHGPHFCVGGPLARLEATIALEVLTQRFPQLQLDGPDGGYHHTFVARARRSVHVRLQPSPSADTAPITRRW